MAHPLKTLLSENRELLPLLAKAQALSALQRHFASVAPPQLVQSGQPQVLGLQLGTLSIAVANAAVAAKLRQLAPELAALMQNRGCEVSGIRVKVQVSFDRPQPKITPHKLGKPAQHALNELSDNLDDSPLKLALKKLAKQATDPDLCATLTPAALRILAMPAFREYPASRPAQSAPIKTALRTPTAAAR